MEYFRYYSKPVPYTPTPIWLGIANNDPINLYSALLAERQWPNLAEDLLLAVHIFIPKCRFMIILEKFKCRRERNC